VKLGFVVQRWGLGGGTEGYAVGLARALAEAGHHVTVLCAADDLGAAQGIAVERIALFRGGLRGRLAFAWAASDLVRGRFDLVQGFGRTLGHDVFRAGGGVHAAWLAASGTPWRRWSPVEAAEAWLDRRALESARVVVCNSEMAAADVFRLTRARRVEVVRNGVDLARFRPDPLRRAQARAAWGADGRVLLFFGSGFRRKGLAVAAEAFRRVAGPSDRFVVMGDDAHAAHHLAGPRSALGTRLVVHGPERAPEHWIPGADATILPTRYDPAANATLEALACGVPAVTSGRDGAAEIVPEPRWIVRDPGDVEGFAAAVDAAWGVLARDRCRAAAEPWTIARNAARMLRIYASLVDSG
jgi:UDP-glucose:(heptosyl)LPS alpha-1,3-glucosyltransferase